MFYLVHQQTALLLLAAGALGVCWECLRPGLVVPGVAGCTMILLALRGNPAVFAPVALALIFLAVGAAFETHGLLAVAGAISLGWGAMLLTGSIAAAVVFAIGFGLLLTCLFSAAVRARRNKLNVKLRS